MKKELGQILFSATDLANHLGCEFATLLDRQYVNGDIALEYHTDPMLELLIELGNRHEAAYLDYLRDQGKSVVELDEFGGNSGTDKAIEAMRQGVDVIAQASFVSLPWRGRTDFLFKVNRPSKLGDWSYEVADTKLSQATKATAVLQLCLYSELVAEIQGVLPEKMYVVKPGKQADAQQFDVDSLRVADYMAYYRMAKSRFDASMANDVDPNQYPDPCSHCQICNWWPRCNQVWRDDDHLSFVAGIAKSQRMELEQHGITTLEEFAKSKTALPEHPKRGSIKTWRVNGSQDETGGVEQQRHQANRPIESNVDARPAQKMDGSVWD